MLERERVNLMSEVIDDITPDLKTPISVIHANVYLMRKTQTPEDQERRLDAITAAADQVERLTNSLTTVSELDEGREVQFAPVNVNHLIRGIANRFAARTEKLGLELNTLLDDDLPDIIARENDLQRALANLLDNAVTYTPTGGSITLTSRQQQNGLVMVVEDTGEGIEAEALPQIFERFYRSDHARSAHTGGSGLGLSIVKKIVEIHAGRITVESTPGVGTAFTLWLPTA